jgi:hypothetical protein
MRRLFIPIVGSFLPAACGNGDLTCSSSTTLESLVTCISMQMPQRDSNGLRRANVHSASGPADSRQSDAARIV